MAALFKAPKAPKIEAPKPVTRDETQSVLDDRLRLMRRKGRASNILTRRRKLGTSTVGGASTVGTSAGSSTAAAGTGGSLSTGGSFGGGGSRFSGAQAV